MRNYKRLAAVGSLISVVAVICCIVFPSLRPWHEKDTRGVEAYVYAYPLVLVYTTQQVMLKKGGKVNEFVHAAQFPTYKFQDIVRPNVDTLYSLAWLDLSQGPLVLSVPDTNERYYLIECMDAWTNVFASLGKRTTGTRAQRFFLVGPSWEGAAPQDFQMVTSPTNLAMVVIRIQTNGTADYDAVHTLQRGFRLQPFAGDSDASRSLAPEVTYYPLAHEKGNAPPEIVARMDVKTFYDTFLKALVGNPPALADGPLLKKLEGMGIPVKVPGSEWNPDHEQVTLLTRAHQRAYRDMLQARFLIPRVHGWGMLRAGVYGINYLMRALVAYVGLGANSAEDALYPTTFVDSRGRRLNGKHAYIIHFEKGKLPPVNAFWSLTMYNEDYFLVQNSIDRYALGDRDTLKFNEDGSLDIFIQHASPGKDKESNWLPAPAGAFNLSLRLYWPQPSALEGTWEPPVVARRE